MISDCAISSWICSCWPIPTASYYDVEFIVSTDPVPKLRKFADAQGLDFALLSDEDHAVHDEYGVWVEKKNYGRTYWGTQRSTYLIDPAGIVRLPKVLRVPEGHIYRWTENPLGINGYYLYSEPLSSAPSTRVAVRNHRLVAYN